MDRRKFIKNTLITAAGAVIIGAATGCASNKNPKGDKKMKILVITGSPRKNGNSNTLADNFIKGAEEAGHSVARFDSAFKNVHPCVACNKCGMNGQAVGGKNTCTKRLIVQKNHNASYMPLLVLICFQ